MEVIVLPDTVTVGRHAAQRLARTIETRRTPVIGVATGSTPLNTYQELAALASRGLDVSRTTAFALDEYVNLDYSHPESYHSTIDREVTRRIGLKPALVHVPHGSADDLTVACEAYEQAISDAGGIDIQLLGLGANGHVGFNEPGSSLGSSTRVKTLAPQTRRDNARFFGGDMDSVPVHCVTQGIGTILRARQLLLVATGAGKADAVATTIEGPLGAYCPSTALQLHPHVTVLLDEAAAAKLRHREYYDFVREHAAVGSPSAAQGLFSSFSP